MRRNLRRGSARGFGIARSACRPGTAIFISSLAIGLGACTGWMKDQAEVDKHYRYTTAPKAGSQVVTGEIATFVQSVAAGRTTQEGFMLGRRYRGVYIGPAGGCERVALYKTDTQNKSERLPDSYNVCAGVVTKAPAGMPPSFPDAPDATSVLDGARRGALRYGSQTVPYQGYLIQTARIGLSGNTTCQPVETKVTYQGELVYHDIRTMCQ